MARFLSHSHLARVTNYIRDLEKHHRRKSFQEEYVEFLGRHHVPYDQRYIFRPAE
jgi:putative transposase